MQISKVCLESYPMPQIHVDNATNIASESSKCQNSVWKEKTFHRNALCTTSMFSAYHRQSSFWPWDNWGSYFYIFGNNILRFANLFMTKLLIRIYNSFNTSPGMNRFQPLKAFETVHFHPSIKSMLIESGSGEVTTPRCQQVAFLTWGGPPQISKFINPFLIATTKFTHRCW